MESTSTSEMLILQFILETITHSSCMTATTSSVASLGDSTLSFRTKPEDLPEKTQSIAVLSSSMNTIMTLMTIAYTKQSFQKEKSLMRRYTENSIRMKS